MPVALRNKPLLITKDKAKQESLTNPTENIAAISGVQDAKSIEAPSNTPNQKKPSTPQL